MSIHTRFISLAIITVALSTDSFGQFFTPYSSFTRPNTSIDWTISPRGIALGEATVALPGYEEPFASNPAGLASRHGFWTQYARQPFFADAGDESYYRSWSLGAVTSFGAFEATYRRLDYGTIRFTSAEAPDGYAGITSYDYTVGLAWGYSIGRGIQVGATVKAFNQKSSVAFGQIPSSGTMLLPDSKPAYIFDLGAIANIGQLFGEGSVSDSLSLGLAIQGFGTPFRLTYTWTSQGYPPMYPPVSTTTAYAWPVPRNLRIGFSYQLTVVPQTVGDLSPCSISVMGEVRDILNAPMFYAGTYWGLGMELRVYEMLALRLGGLAYPYESVYSHENNLHPRYGVGMRLPLKKLSSSLPSFVLVGDYAYFPVYVDSRSVIRLSSVGLQFEP